MSKNKIPKKIHYCWFGSSELPISVKKCIDSWKEKCPDYEIIQWNETNYDVTKNRYMYEAYKQKKWGFVPDYARLDIIYTHGGIYLDTDVEIIKSLDLLLQNEMFVGLENNYVALGLGFGGTKGNIHLFKMMQQYNEISFINEDGNLNLTPSPRYTTEYFQRLGMENENRIQCVKGVSIYPTEYFCPKNFLTGELHITNNTYSIHHYDASWWGEKEKKEYEKQVKLREKNIWLWRIHNGISVLKKEGVKVLINKIRNMKE